MRSPYRVPSSPAVVTAVGHEREEWALGIVWCAAWIAGLCYVALAFVHRVPFDAPRSVAAALVVLAPVRLLALAHRGANVAE